MIRQLLLVLCLFYSLLLWADDDHNKAKYLLDSGKIISLQSLLSDVQKKFPGRILEVELENKGQMLLYEVELLTPDGQILELIFDASSGRHLFTEVDD